MAGKRATADIIHVQPVTACDSCRVRRLCLPVSLRRGDMGVMSQLVRGHKNLGHGGTVYRVGDRFRSIYAIQKGTVKTYGLTSDGKEQVTGFHLPGEIVGLDGVDTNVHSCTAVALEPTEICDLPFDQLETVSRRVPGLQHEVSRIMGREIEQGGRMLVLIGRMNAEQRVACFLQNIRHRYCQYGDATDTIHLPMSREDIGNYLGLTLETVSRRLSGLQEQGIIHIDKRDIRFLRMDLLSELCKS